MEVTLDDPLDLVPAELKTLKQWVTWQNRERDGELSKFPSQGGGSGASSSDPTTWTTFEKAVYFSKLCHRVEGVGFMFSAEDPFCGVDLDGCRDPESGSLSAWASEILDHFHTYCEISPSGTGVKLICRAKSPFAQGRNRKLKDVDRISSKTPGLEIYDHLRFWTFTGRRLPGKPSDVNECQDGLDWLCQRYADVLADSSNNHTNGNGASYCNFEPAPDDSKILDVAYRSSSGEKIRSLFAGDHKGYPSASEADMALASLLAFWTGPDLSRLMSLMQQSGLVRPKWTKMHGDATYLETTCRKAIDSTSQFFQWDYDKFKGTTFKFRSSATTHRTVEAHPEPLSQSEFPTPQPAEPAYKPEKPTGRRIEVVHAREFASHDYHPQWLVKRVLVAGQPAICGGRSKAMKTSNMVDLAVSIGTGTPFLGHFETTRQTVTILSGESGAFTIQETAKRVADARGVHLADADVYFGFQLPQVSRAPDILATIDMINETGSKVVIIDPAYLCVLSGTDGRQASNVFEMGSVLLQLTVIGERTGSTVIMCHHCRKSPGEGRDRHDPPDLEELSMAGFAEWARQWILIGRREPFEAGTGLHKLWLNVGGSVGFSGCWSVDIDEGAIRDDFTGRKWDVTVGTIGDVKEEKERAKQKKAEERQSQNEWARQQRVTKALRLNPAGISQTQLRSVAAMNAQALADTILSMRQKGLVETFEGMSGTRHCELLKLTETAPENDNEKPRDYSKDFDPYDPYSDSF